MSNHEDLIEELSNASHEGWMEGKRAQGIAARRSELDEELMVPYGELSEKAKDLDRYNVKAVLAAVDRAGYELVRRDGAR